MAPVVLDGGLIVVANYCGDARWQGSARASDVTDPK